MTPKQCQVCGCQMTVDDEGMPYHRGKHWAELDITFCLKRQLDVAINRITRLEKAGEELASFCSAEGALRKWSEAKEAKP